MGWCTQYALLSTFCHIVLDYSVEHSFTFTSECDRTSTSITAVTTRSTYFNTLRCVGRHGLELEFCYGLLVRTFSFSVTPQKSLKVLGTWDVGPIALTVLTHTIDYRCRSEARFLFGNEP